MKARPYNYFNIKTHEIKYGVQAYAFGKWMPVARNGKPLMFDTEAERDAEIEVIKQQRKETDEGQRTI